MAVILPGVVPIPLLILRLTLRLTLHLRSTHTLILQELINCTFRVPFAPHEKASRGCLVEVSDVLDLADQGLRGRAARLSGHAHDSVGVRLGCLVDDPLQLMFVSEVMRFDSMRKREVRWV